MRKILFILSWLLLFSFQSKAQDVCPLMPQDGEVGEWLLTGKTENYKTDELFFLINGGADLYLEYGFAEVWATTYENNTEEQIKVEIYAMDADTSAYGIFTMNRVSDGETAQIGQLAQKTSYSLTFWQDQYYVLIRSSQKEEHIQDAICLIGEKIQNKINTEGNTPAIIPGELALSPKLKYFKGVLGLSTIYYFDYTNVFQFSHGFYQYQTEGGRIELYYTDNEAMHAGYENAVSVLSKKSKFVEVENGNNTLKLVDKKGKTLRISKIQDYIQIDLI